MIKIMKREFHVLIIIRLRSVIPGIMLHQEAEKSKGSIIQMVKLIVPDQLWYTENLSQFGITEKVQTDQTYGQDFTHT
jgi:hypothetical protein